jgi:glutamine synthetase
MGWELEWILGHAEKGRFEPLRDWTAYGAATFPKIEALVLDLFDALEASGLTPEQIHPEYSTGQIELSLPARDPVGACDDAVFARHLVRTLSERHGFRASFAPRAAAGSVGSGAHVHVSVWASDLNQLTGGAEPGGVRPTGAAFVAGVLDELPALTAIGCPSPLSYARLQPSHWAGAYACWGHENREAALRLAAAEGPRAPHSANLEWKAVDGAANPYLAAAGLLGAGLSGIERQLVPPPPFEADPAALSETEREERAIRRLPLTLADSTEALLVSATLRDAYGPYLHNRIVAVRRAEVAAAEGADESKLVELYCLRY